MTSYFYTCDFFSFLSYYFILAPISSFVQFAFFFNKNHTRLFLKRKKTREKKEKENVLNHKKIQFRKNLFLFLLAGKESKIERKIKKKKRF